MKIVIDIPEDLYKHLKNCISLDNVEKAIVNGTPLPKGYGRLVDMKRLFEQFKNDCTGYCADCDRWTFEGCEHLLNAPTIIEGDETEEK